MCNLYSMTKSIDAMRKLFAKFDVPETNLPPLPGIFPDYEAPIIRNHGEGVAELVMTRWGMPSSKLALFEAASKRADKLRAKGKVVDFDALLPMEPDSGTTNVRNTNSAHWKRWLGVDNRCLVPFSSFSEFNRDLGGDIWFALDEDRPLAFFAGIWAPQWTSVRKVSKGLETIDVFAFLTTTPNAEVGAVHPKAMPVILTTPEECEAWMTAPWELARGLQRPLPDGTLEIVARGLKKDEAGYV
ncbi:putative SOS response-associated peptidase YedK [Bosea sp. BE125]|uniref:SOS response-associated peptidase n=1 Tax=Bosea sp. BE125 TaxID=2817909 RepID=UPI0028574BEB|nr:SOS response-associated peptidase family protein [Bosea sp. BE125]MDR6872171.1 putative SOS response-associated peptidase YedK [Bosea sp. BE125]